MLENLIYPEKIPDMIVRFRCNNCQYLGEAAEFGQIIMCPQCQEKHNLAAILNNRQEIDMGRKRGLPFNLYPIIILIGLVMYLAYKFLPIVFFPPIFIVLMAVAIIISFKGSKK